MKRRYEEALQQNTDAEGDTVTLTIRQAELADAKALLGFTRHVGKNTDYLTFGEEGVDISIEAEQEIIAKYLAADTSIMLVVEADDQIIGVGDVATLPGHKERHVAELGISLVKEYWGYGIARMLLEEMICFAENVGLEVLTLEVVTENQRAISLYERLGFEQVGHLKRRLKSGFAYYDTYIMERLL